MTKPKEDNSDIDWLRKQADYAEDPAEIAALALVGMQMVEKRLVAQEGRPERDVTSKYLNQE